MARDYYDVLQVHREASSEEIHKAYRLLAMRNHPDRNSTPDAALMMSVINEAYSVLSEPARRRRYDEERSGSKPTGIAAPILSAASESLLKQGWVVSHNDGMNIVLEQGMRAVRVSLVDRLDNASLRKIGRQFAGLSVVLALEIEPPINLSFQTVVIDLMRSRQHGAPFPDDTYRALFAPFLSSNGLGTGTGI